MPDLSPKKEQLLSADFTNTDNSENLQDNLINYSELSKLNEQNEHIIEPAPRIQKLSHHMNGESMMVDMNNFKSESPTLLCNILPFQHYQFPIFDLDQISPNSIHPEYTCPQAEFLTFSFSKSALLHFAAVNSDGLSFRTLSPLSCRLTIKTDSDVHNHDISFPDEHKLASVTTILRQLALLDESPEFVLSISNVLYREEHRHENILFAVEIHQFELGLIEKIGADESIQLNKAWLMVQEVEEDRLFSSFTLYDTKQHKNIKIPARSRKCKHPSVFDLATFLCFDSMAIKNCPICDQALAYEDLVIDSYLQELINTIETQSTDFPFKLVQSVNYYFTGAIVYTWDYSPTEPIVLSLFPAEEVFVGVSSCYQVVDYLRFGIRECDKCGGCKHTLTQLARSDKLFLLEDDCSLGDPARNAPFQLLVRADFSHYKKIDELIDALVLAARDFFKVCHMSEITRAILSSDGDNGDKDVQSLVSNAIEVLTRLLKYHVFNEIDDYDEGALDLILSKSSKSTKIQQPSDQSAQQNLELDAPDSSIDRPTSPIVVIPPDYEKDANVQLLGSSHILVAIPNCVSIPEKRSPCPINESASSKVELLGTNEATQPEQPNAESKDCDDVVNYVKNEAAAAAAASSSSSFSTPDQSVTRSSRSSSGVSTASSTKRATGASERGAKECAGNDEPLNVHQNPGTGKAASGDDLAEDGLGQSPDNKQNLILETADLAAFGASGVSLADDVGSSKVPLPESSSESSGLTGSPSVSSGNEPTTNATFESSTKTDCSTVSDSFIQGHIKEPKSPKNASSEVGASKGTSPVSKSKKCNEKTPQPIQESPVSATPLVDGFIQPSSEPSSTSTNVQDDLVDYTSGEPERFTILYLKK